MPQTDYYKTLGASMSDTKTDIENKYKKLAQKYHPDSPTGEAGIFKEITEAYRILSDTDKRREYNRHRVLKTEYTPNYEPEKWQNTKKAASEKPSAYDEKVIAAVNRFNKAFNS